MRGYAREKLAVWAGRGAKAASCLVIVPMIVPTVVPMVVPTVVPMVVPMKIRLDSPLCVQWWVELRVQWKSKIMAPPQLPYHPKGGLCGIMSFTHDAQLYSDSAAQDTNCSTSGAMWA